MRTRCAAESSSGQRLARAVPEPSASGPAWDLPVLGSHRVGGSALAPIVARASSGQAPPHQLRFSAPCRLRVSQFTRLPQARLLASTFFCFSRTRDPVIRDAWLRGSCARASHSGSDNIWNCVRCASCKWFCFWFLIFEFLSFGQLENRGRCSHEVVGAACRTDDRTSRRRYPRLLGARTRRRGEYSSFFVRDIHQQCECAPLIIRGY